MVHLLFVGAALASEVALWPEDARWTAGVSYGAGLRVLPSRAVPDGTALRLDLHVLTVQRTLRDEATLGLERLEVQVDPVHLWATHGATTAPRLPLTLYACWLRPIGGKWDLTVARGLYAAVGWDAVVVEDRLRHRPGGTLAPSVRVGLERNRWLWPAMAGSWALRGDLGLSLSADPHSFAASRYLRVGLERSLTWGRR